MEQNRQSAPREERTHAPRRRRRKRRGPARVIGTVFKVLGTLVLVGATTCAILACLGVIYLNTVIIPEADLDLYELTMDMNQSSILYYKDPQTGETKELRTIHGNENRIWIKYNDIPKNLINAAIAIEDKRFESHQGVDWLRTANAVLRMFTGGDIQGGSTITQQLIKNVTLEKDVTVKRKITEIFRALEFEKKYSKEDIMEWYLNYIYLGQGCSGVYTASYMYFGKNVKELDLAECASLISITNNPSLFDPYRAGLDEEGNLDPTWGQRNNTKRAINVLWQMYDQGKITREEYDQAEAEVKAGLNFTSASASEENQSTGDGTYSWYEDLVVSDVIQALMDKGLDKKVAENMLFYGGLKIETCFDPEIQSKVDEVYTDLDNLPVISSSGQQLQSAIVIIDRNGDVVALAGGMGEKEGSRIWSRATDTRRPPGSSFKPLSVYAPAIDAGLVTPATVLDDAPYRLEGESAWPVNVDRIYRGRMSVFEGVQRSSNPLAVRVLAMLSPQESFNFLTGKLGFQDDLVYSETRGGKVFSDVDLAPLSMGGLTDGVSVLHMAAAYSIFPRGGVYLEPRTFTVVRDSKGKVILDNTEDRVGVPVVSERTAWYMNSMLKNVVINGTGKSANFDGMTVAGKTGSTTSNNDRWFVGYTPYYTAAVWVGYDQQERIRTNGNPAPPLWKQVMAKVHEGLEDRDFATPSGLVTVEQVCAESGMLETEYCLMDPRGPQETTAQLFKGDDALGYCNIHTAESVVEICLESPILNSKGEETGMYHLANQFCPAECRRSVCLMKTDRVDVKDTLANDYLYTKQYFDSLGAEAYCTLHTTPPEPAVYDPATFDPLDESTYPTQEQWPGFVREDPTTWPYVGGTAPGTQAPPSEEPPSEEPPAEEPPPEEGPGDEPYIPAA